MDKDRYQVDLRKFYSNVDTKESDTIGSRVCLVDNVRGLLELNDEKR